MAAMGSRGDIYKANQTLIGERSNPEIKKFSICQKKKSQHFNDFKQAISQKLKIVTNNSTSREQWERGHGNYNERRRSSAKE